MPSSKNTHKNPPDERVVYLVLKNLFKGPEAKVRQPKSIHKVIQRNETNGDVASLVDAHGINAICNTTRTLLTEQIFESTLNAKLRFPEIFDISPAQSAEREASEAEAARSEADALKRCAGDKHDIKTPTKGIAKTECGE